MSAYHPPHKEWCHYCHPVPTRGALLSTVVTVLALVVFWVAMVVIGLNLAAWGQVHVR